MTSDRYGMGYQNVNAPFTGKDACSLLELGLVHTVDDSDPELLCRSVVSPLPPQSLLRPQGVYHIHKTIILYNPLYKCAI